MRKIKPDVIKQKKNNDGKLNQKCPDEWKEMQTALKVTSANLQKNQKKTGVESPPKSHAEHSVNKICLKTLTYFSGIN